MIIVLFLEPFFSSFFLFSTLVRDLLLLVLVIVRGVIVCLLAVLLLDFDSVGTFFLNEGILGMLPLNPNPENPDLRRPVPVSILSRCLSKKLEMSATRVILGTLSEVSCTLDEGSEGFVLLLLVLFAATDGTFECWKETKLSL